MCVHRIDDCRMRAKLGWLSAVCMENSPLEFFHASIRNLRFTRARGAQGSAAFCHTEIGGEYRWALKLNTTKRLPVTTEPVAYCARVAMAYTNRLKLSVPFWSHCRRNNVKLFSLRQGPFW
jgi:hypothetical protein